MIIVLPGKVELYIAERIFIMDKSEKYYPYSQYLKERYGKKVYKLPVNLPVSCPNRINGNGCSFCAEKGTGFEAMDSAVSVTEQLLRTRDYISLLLIFKTLRIHFYRLKYSVHISRKHPAFLILLKLPSLHVRIVYGMTTWMYYIQSGKKPESRLRSNSDFKQ